MRRSRISVGLSLVAVVASSAFLAGCGVTTVVDPVAQAATQSEKSGGADVSMTVSVAVPGSPAVVVNASGVIGDGSADLTLDLGSAGKAVGLGKVEELLVKEDGSSVIYLDMGSLAQTLGTDKRWLRIDLAKVGGFGSTFSKMLLGGGQNPMDTLTALEKVGDFQEVGAATIDGTETTHYQGTVDVEKALKDTGIDLSSLPGGSGASVPSTIPYEVYVTSDGKVRRVRTTVGRRRPTRRPMRLAWPNITT